MSVFLVFIFIFLGEPSEVENATKTNVSRDSYFDIESGRPLRPVRPPRPKTLSKQATAEVNAATPSPALEVIPGTTEEVRVLKVRDTEKIDATRSRRFSLLGVRAFSRRELNEQDREYGFLAYIVVRGLIEGKRVIVEYDKGSRRLHGYIPVYIILPDGKLLNQILVKNGLGLVDEHWKKLKYGKILQKSRKCAQKKRVGYWKNVGKRTRKNSKD